MLVGQGGGVGGLLSGGGRSPHPQGGWRGVRGERAGRGVGDKRGTPVPAWSELVLGVRSMLMRRGVCGLFRAALFVLSRVVGVWGGWRGERVGWGCLRGEREPSATPRERRVGEGGVRVRKGVMERLGDLMWGVGFERRLCCICIFIHIYIYIYISIYMYVYVHISAYMLIHIHVHIGCGCGGG